MLLTIIIAVVIFCLLWLLIDRLPIPASTLPIKQILYCLLIIVAIFFLGRLAHLF